MPARSPLLSPSISEPSNVYIGKDVSMQVNPIVKVMLMLLCTECDTSATSLSVLAVSAPGCLCFR